MTASVTRIGIAFAALVDRAEELVERPAVDVLHHEEQIAPVDHDVERGGRTLRRKTRGAPRR